MVEQFEITDVASLTRIYAADGQDWLLGQLGAVPMALRYQFLEWIEVLAGQADFSDVGALEGLWFPVPGTVPQLYTLQAGNYAMLCSVHARGVVINGLAQLHSFDVSGADLQQIQRTALAAHKFLDQC